MGQYLQPTPSTRKKAPDGRVYYSYADIHETVSKFVIPVEKFKPDYIIAIGGGGFIPGRMLRSWLNVPMLTITVKRYDDDTDIGGEVKKVQWIEDEIVSGKRVIVVDEVDDTRTTLQFCVNELMKINKPAALGVAVVHNKLKEKTGKLPDGIPYFAGEEIPDYWTHYPWDAPADSRDIREHERIAMVCMGGGGMMGKFSWVLALVLSVGVGVVAVGVNR